MKGKRTGIDFSKHEVIITESEGLIVHFLKVPNTYNRCIRYINTNGILVVNGDFGNWIFCRSFVPSKDGYVSDDYWLEKLETASTQVGERYSETLTRERINQWLNGGIEEYGYEGKEANQVREYMEELLTLTDDEQGFTNYAYRDSPHFFDSEYVPLCKEIKPWLKAVFDGFDEMCRRLKEAEMPLSTITERPYDEDIFD